MEDLLFERGIDISHETVRWLTGYHRFVGVPVAAVLNGLYAALRCWISALWGVGFVRIASTCALEPSRVLNAWGNWASALRLKTTNHSLIECAAKVLEEYMANRSV